MEGPATNGGARSGSQTATTDAVVAKWLKQYPAEASSQEANRILNGFKTNWISTVAHWARVPEVCYGPILASQLHKLILQ